jgi:branched-subunit amino acid transport protein AzlD
MLIKKETRIFPLVSFFINYSNNSFLELYGHKLDPFVTALLFFRSLQVQTESFLLPLYFFRSSQAQTGPFCYRFTLFSLFTGTYLFKGFIQIEMDLYVLLMEIRLRQTLSH